MKYRMLAILFLALLPIIPLSAQEAYTRIPAKFLFALGAEGTALSLEQPQRIRLDRHRGEIYIADTGHNRIVILDPQGNYLFDFRHQDKLRSPSDVAVDAEGRIYVLCNPVDGQAIQVFDYNGDYLHPFIIRGGPAADSLGFSSMIIDEESNFYLADEIGGRILSCNLYGDYRMDFSIFPELDEKIRREQILGSLYEAGGLLYLPVPMIGSVYCYNEQGSLIKALGRKGGGYGELAFPTSATLDTNGNVLVVDKHRHTVISFDSAGNVNGEFGGLGRDPGWFYHPTFIMTDTRNRVWVAQGFRNLVQVLQLPDPDESVPAQMERTIVVDE